MKKKNYLDHIFEKNPVFDWKENEKGNVCIIVEWKNIYSRMAQRFWGKPKTSEIEMDALGSFVWKQIDGKRTVYEIAAAVKERFGQDAEPLYERLVKFFEIMRDNKYIKYVK